MAQWSEARVLFEPRDMELRFLPEGPFGLADGRFSWVGIQHGGSARYGSLNIFDTKTGENQSFRLPGRPGFARPTDDPSKFVIGAERELGIYDIGTGEWSVFCTGIDQRVENTIVNDGTMWQDNLIFGTKDLEFKTKKAGLYLFRGRDRQLIQLRDDQICSNGKAVIPGPGGGLTLLDIDTPTRKVVRYELDIAGGKLGPAETVIDLAGATGFPDGMTLSPDGRSAIISFYNPDEAEFGLTQQYDLQTGRLEFSWRTPASPQNTCPLLLRLPGGDVQLVITTAIEHMASERLAKASQSGCLFVADTAFKVDPSQPFDKYPLAAVA
jgi:sugar lactone lactonase YvrE